MLKVLVDNVVGPISEKDWSTLGLLRKEILKKKEKKELSKLDRIFLRKKEIGYKSTLSKYLPKVDL